MSFIKHLGKHSDRKVAIVYRTLPGDEHMALVLYTETLPRSFQDAVMKVIESDVAQSSDSLADAMFKSLLPDGRQMLQVMHQEGKLKKVQSNQILITPNASSQIRLDELNKILDGIESGGDAAEKMADLDKNAGLVDPLEKRQNAQIAAEAGDGALDDASLGADILKQSVQMAGEAKALVAESKRLEKEAFTMNPALKPKRTRKKKASTK